MMNKVCSCALAIGLALGVQSLGVAAVEADFDGSPVSTISGVSLGCKAPYALTRDCSGWSGATRKVPALSPDFRVAGSADGTVVLVMSTSLWPTAGRTEHTAALVVRDVAATVGAKVVKVEAVSAGPRIVGYVLSFDREVYETLTTHPGVPTPVAKIPPGVQLEADSPLVSCRWVDSLPSAAGPGAGAAASAAVASSSTDIAAPAPVPTGRRYATVVRDSGQVSLMRVGTTVLTNVAIRMEVTNQVLDCVRIAVQSVLNPSRGFELVPTEQSFGFVLPPFHVNPFDGGQDS